MYILTRVNLSQSKNVYMPGQREGKKSEGINKTKEKKRKLNSRKKKKK